MSSVVSVPEVDFETAVSSGKVTLVDFWAEWCGPCRQLSPVLDQIAAERPEFTVVKVNVDEAGDVARQFNVTSIPRLLVMDADGTVVADFVGPKPKRVLVSELEKV